MLLALCLPLIDGLAAPEILDPTDNHVNDPSVLMVDGFYDPYVSRAAESLRDEIARDGVP